MYKWNGNKYSVWLFVFSLSFIYQEKKKNCKYLPGCPRNDVRKGVGGCCDWTTHPLSSDCVTASSTCWLRALDLGNEVRVAETLPCFPPSCSAELLPYSHLLASCSSPYDLILALLCSGGKVAGQPTVLSGEGLHRRHWLTTTCKHKTRLGFLEFSRQFWSFAPSCCFQERGSCFFFFFFPLRYPIFHQFVQLATVEFSIDHGSKERRSHKSGIHSKNKGLH